MYLEIRSIRFITLLMILATFIPAMPCHARQQSESRLIEGFEGTETSWRLQSNPGENRMLKHSRTATRKLAGNQSEFFHFSIASATGMKLVHSIPPAQLIRDFCPQLSLFSNRNRFRFSVRVVLPKTPDPLGTGPLQLLIRIGQSTSLQKWETLSAQPGEVLRSTQRRLRSIQFDNPKLQVDLDGAYCDKIVLGGFDATEGDVGIWIDEIRVAGLLPSQSASVATGRKAPAYNRQPVSLRGDLLLVGEQPVFLRVVEYNGESASYLKGLGFNTVLLKQFPSEDFLDQSLQSRLMVICPPPSNTELAQRIKPGHEKIVIGWNLGSNLTSSELPAIKSQLKERQYRISDRPTICHAHFPIREYGHAVDILRLSHDCIGLHSGFESFQKYIEINQDNSNLRLVDIDTQPAVEILQHYSGRVRKTVSQSATLQQIQMQVLEAVQSGARGVIFESNENLKQSSPANQSLRPVFQQVNQDLLQIEPWLAGGRVKPIRNSSVKHSGVRNVHAIMLDRSQILLVQHKQNRRPADKSPMARKLTLEIPSLSNTPRVYRILDRALIPVIHKQINGRIEIELQEQRGLEKFVLTEDQVSLQFIRRVSERLTDKQVATRKWQIVRNQHMTIFPIVEELARHQVRNPILYAQLQESSRSLGLAELFLRQGRTESAFMAIENAQEHVSAAEFLLKSGYLEHDEIEFNTDPIETIPYRLRWRKTEQENGWKTLYSFEDSIKQVANLSRDGWKQHLNQTGGSSGQVSLKTPDEKLSRNSLQLSAWSPSGRQRGLIDVTPVWLSSPTFSVPANQRVRIEGRLLIDQPISSSCDGLMIMETAGGPPLAQRFYHAKKWKRFSLDRVFREPTDFQVVIAMTGLGSARIADLKISIRPSLESSNKGPANNAAVAQRSRELR